MIRKPSWMTMKLWDELLARCNGIPRCEVTGETENLSVDHLQPRWLGGKDEASNLRFLAARLNAKKGTRPDQYWSGTFWFDQKPEFNALRTAQLDGYNAVIDQRDWFGRPFSDISRFIYCLCWIVGAGKTLAILTTSCAMNAVITAQYGAGYARRADRVLVLCKEEAIRDQIAKDLVKDSVRYGLFPNAPKELKILVIKEGWQWSEQASLDGADVVVACIQQLWGDDGTRPKEFYKILHEFPLIFIDEPHYAWKRVLGIVEAASTSVCFGFTGTPIDKHASALKDRMIALHIHGYQEANEGDRSMKFLPDTYDACVRELKITEAEALKRGKLEIINDADEDWYMKNIEPAKSVVREVIREMKKRDRLNVNLERAAQHRLQDMFDLSITVALTFSSHGMIVVPNVEFGNILCDVANRLFDGNRNEYPLEDGWRGEIVHAEGIEAGGNKRVHKPLSPDHPWLRAKDLPGYRADQSCARLIIVCGMGREGVNNPLCGPIGVCLATESRIEAVQRWIGRQIRAVIEWRDKAKTSLSVPPSDLDRVCIITHETFGIREVIEDAIYFTLHMQDELTGPDGLKTIADLQAGHDPSTVKPPTTEGSLPIKTKVEIAGILGGGADDVDGWWPSGSDIDGSPLAEPMRPEHEDDQSLFPPVCGGDDDLDREIIKFITGTDPLSIPVPGTPPNPKVKKVEEWINQLRDDPKKAGDLLGFNLKRLEPIYTVMREYIEENPTEDEIRSFLRCFYPALADVDFSVGVQREMARTIFLEHARHSMLPRLAARHSIHQIHQFIEHDIKDALGGHYKPPIKANGKSDGAIFHISVAVAIKDVLGVPREEQAANNTKWDNAYTHAILLRPDVRKQIEGFVCGRLIESGQCPSLKGLRR